MFEHKETELKFEYAGRQELPQITDLWEKVFGDTSEYIRSFADEFFADNKSFAVVKDGDKLAAMSSIFPVGSLEVPLQKEDAQGKSHSFASQVRECMMVYAVATEEAYRCGGIAQRMLKRIIEEHITEHMCCVISPASEYLFGYYERHLGFRDAFLVKEAEYSRDEISSQCDACAMTLAPDEYNRLRNTYLEGHTFLKFTDKSISFQKKICRACGGDLYKISLPDGKCAAMAVEYDRNETACVKELLCDDACINDVLCCLAKIAPANINKFNIRMPAWQGDGFAGNIRRIGQIVFGGEPCKSFDDILPGYIGFVFD